MGGSSLRCKKADGRSKTKEVGMRIVQYINGGQRGCGVQVGDNVFYSGYPDTLALVRDGERGLEQAQQFAESTDPVHFDRIIEPIRPGQSSARGLTTEVTETRTPATSS